MGGCCGEGGGGDGGCGDKPLGTLGGRPWSIDGVFGLPFAGCAGRSDMSRCGCMRSGDETRRQVVKKEAVRRTAPL